MYLYGNSIPFHNNILMYRHGFHSVKLGIVHSSPLWYPQRKTMVNCGRYRQVSGIGNLWKCIGVKLWTIHSLAVWKPFWKTMESASWGPPPPLSVFQGEISYGLDCPPPGLLRGGGDISWFLPHNSLWTADLFPSDSSDHCSPPLHCTPADFNPLSIPDCV